METTDKIKHPREWPQRARELIFRLNKWFHGLPKHERPTPGNAWVTYFGDEELKELAAFGFSGRHAEKLLNKPISKKSE